MGYSMKKKNEMHIDYEEEMRLRLHNRLKEAIRMIIKLKENRRNKLKE